MVIVSVPATSANVGPGFDCMGLALSMRGTFTFRKMESGIIIKGCDAAYCNEENLVYQTFFKTMTAIGETIQGIEITIDCDIPLQRGLGSSAACIAAGAAGANALFGNPLSMEELFAICTEMEGHPDNVAPALFGGLTVSFMEDHHPVLVPYQVHETFHFMAVVPEATISTQAAREILPKQLSYPDAVFNIGHCAAFLKAMETGNSELLSNACHDRLHEPYRKQLIPEYHEIESLCKTHGALTMLISGSGSTMLIISDQSSILDNIQNAIETVSLHVTCHPLQVESKGIIIKESKEV